MLSFVNLVFSSNQSAEFQEHESYDIVGVSYDNYPVKQEQKQKLESFTWVRTSAGHIPLTYLREPPTIHVTMSANF